MKLLHGRRGEGMACLESSIQSLQHQARLLHYRSTAFDVMGFYHADIHDWEYVHACRVGGGKKTRSEGAGLSMRQRVSENHTLTRECA